MGVSKGNLIKNQALLVRLERTTVGLDVHPKFTPKHDQRTII